MSILFGYLKHYWKLIIVALLLAAINQVFSLIDPLIFRRIIDNYATKFSQYSMDQFIRGVTLLLLGTILVALISRIAKNFQDYFVNSITQKLGAKMYADGLEHSLQLPYAIFEDQRSGETLGKLQKVRLDTQALISAAINVLFVTIVGFVFIIVYALSINWIIVPMYFLTVPVLAFISIYLSRKVKDVQSKIVAETTALAGATTESLRNIELVKSLGLAHQEIKRLNDTTDKILKLELKKIKYIRSISFVQGTVVNFLRTVILFTVLYLLFTRAITFGQFFSLYFYSFFIFNPLQEIGNIINTYRESEASLNNFAQILKMKKEPVPHNPKALGRVERLEFKDVSFKHQSAENNALTGISFKTAVGSTIAFVGPSGSGKTTLVKLLVGLYQPDAGKVLYNDAPGNEIDLNVLRKQIGLVTQDTQLFAGTIRENLLFVNPEATDQQLLTVLNQSAAQSLMQRADKGLDTLIGEGGVKVSGGEKQRLSIARALLRNPNILVFDEATSALDSLTEQEISKTMRQLSESKTHLTIMIAHRLSTIMHADHIYVLEKGKIVESGKHNHLVAQKGLYYAMWRQQVGE